MESDHFVQIEIERINTIDGFGKVVDVLTLLLPVQVTIESGR
jgi:hypothetical protein